MRGSDTRTAELFSYVDLEKRVPARHPLLKVHKGKQFTVQSAGATLLTQLGNRLCAVAVETGAIRESATRGPVGEGTCPTGYWITSSASAKSLGRISSPRAFAVFKLITSSNLRRLLDRQIRRLGSIENLRGVDAEQAIPIKIMSSIAHEPPGLGVGTPVVNRGNGRRPPIRRRLEEERTGHWHRQSDARDPLRTCRRIAPLYTTR